MFRNYVEVFLSVFQWNLRIPLRHLTSRLHWARWRYKLMWFYCRRRMSEKSKVKKLVLYWREYSFMATALSHEWLLQFKCCLCENFTLFTYLLSIMHQRLVLTLPKWAVFLQREAVVLSCLLSSSRRLKTAGEREAECFTWNFQAEPRERAGRGSETHLFGQLGRVLWLQSNYPMYF